jgi:hypothetical protein
MLRNNAPVKSSNRRSIDWDAMPKSALEADIIAEEKRIAREEVRIGRGGVGCGGMGWVGGVGKEQRRATDAKMVALQ